jgi:hypothetical protein
MEGVGVPMVVTVKEPGEPAVNVVLMALVMTGAVSTVKVKDCEAELNTLVALIVREYVPLVAAAGVPASVAVPFPLSTKVTPLGSAPVSMRAGSGKPVVVTEKEPGPPTENVVALALVIEGASFTVSVKVCVALFTLLVALKVSVYDPPVPAAGVPASVPVLAVKPTPVGNVPDCDRAGDGKPLAVTEKEPADPTVKVVLAGLVMAGGASTFSVKV